MKRRGRGLGYYQALKHYREWRFRNEGEAAHFEAMFTKAINACLPHLERDGHSFLVSRENASDVIVRRLESESGDLLACVERLMDLPARPGDSHENAPSDVEEWFAKSGCSQSNSIMRS